MNIQNRRECFFDDTLINTAETTAEFLLHNPVRKEIALQFDKEWEGDGCGDQCLMHDGEKWRLYYIGRRMNPTERDGAANYYNCVIISLDGIHWERPNLNMFDYFGNSNNNIIDSRNSALHGPLFVFKDTNPGCPESERFKAITCAIGTDALVAYKSADGIHLGEKVIIDKGGFYDTLTTCFWDNDAKLYRCYTRGYHFPKDYDGELTDCHDRRSYSIRIRDITYIESPDFVNWSTPKIIDLGDAEDIELYTNNITPYFRAPHIKVGFPTRYTDRGWTPNYDNLPSPEEREARRTREARFGTAITDCAFITSRDGYRFTRYEDAFMRPGPQEPENWLYGDCYMAYGMIETPSDIKGADNELSLYSYTGQWMGGATNLVRHTIRTDGFVSLHAGGKKEEKIVTKPFVFEGEKLYANISTSARGYLCFKITATDGTRVKSYEIFGDRTDHPIAIAEGDIAALSGKEVVMEICLRDADIYSFRFEK